MTDALYTTPWPTKDFVVASPNVPQCINREAFGRNSDKLDTGGRPPYDVGLSKTWNARKRMKIVPEIVLCN